MSRNISIRGARLELAPRFIKSIEQFYAVCTVYDLSEDEASYLSIVPVEVIRRIIRFAVGVRTASEMFSLSQADAEQNKPPPTSFQVRPKVTSRGFSCCCCVETHTSAPTIPRGCSCGYYVLRNKLIGFEPLELPECSLNVP
jgi:hypothetical protein